MNFLALDLATTTGYCVNDGSAVIVGHWELATRAELSKARQQRMDRRQDIRVTRLHQRILSQHKAASFDFIVFEDVQFIQSLAQAQLWSSLRAAAWIAADTLGVFCECLSVGELKRYATSQWSATKETMQKALLKHSLFKQNALQMTNDEVDATFIWIWANEKLSKTPRIPKCFA